MTKSQIFRIERQLREQIAKEVKEYLEFHNLGISASLVAEFIRTGKDSK